VASEEAQQLLTQYDLDGSRLPVVITLFGRALENPSILEIVDALGATPFQTQALSARYDVTIIGAGPAGLSAAVYGASEGLKTLVLERDSIGGQAGSSMSIRNYPGFTRSVSGSELAMRMFEQAGMFGADFVYGEAVALDRLGEDRVVTLRDGGVVTSRAVIIATGAAYRRLGIQALEAFTGLGVFYGCGCRGGRHAGSECACRWWCEFSGTGGAAPGRARVTR
jgi:thioredoxin reductase (NADPH)